MSLRGIFAGLETAKIRPCFSMNFSDLLCDMPKEKITDTLFADPTNMIVDFEFDEKVASVFSDMIRRSVPGYGTLITLIGLLAEQYAQPQSRIYDLGCSLGATTLSMHHRLRNNKCTIVAVDNSEAMVEKCRRNLPADLGSTSIDVTCADILDVEIQDASVVVINLTMQFIDPHKRLKLLRKIHSGMRPGGALILSEKLVFENPEQQSFQENMHVAFKKANAYSDLEISQKRSALENVLIPDSVATHMKRFQKAGFASVQQWFQCFNFSSFIAIK